MTLNYLRQMFDGVGVSVVITEVNSFQLNFRFNKPAEVLKCGFLDHHRPLGVAFKFYPKRFWQRPAVGVCVFTFRPPFWKTLWSKLK